MAAAASGCSDARIDTFAATRAVVPPITPAACHACSAACARCTRAARPVECSFDAVGASPRRQHAISARARRDAICDGDARCRLMETPRAAAPPRRSAACHAPLVARAPRPRRARGRPCPSRHLIARSGRNSFDTWRRRPQPAPTLESTPPQSRAPSRCHTSQPLAMLAQQHMHAVHGPHGPWDAP